MHPAAVAVRNRLHILSCVGMCHESFRLSHAISFFRRTMETEESQITGSVTMTEKLSPRLMDSEVTKSSPPSPKAQRCWSIKEPCQKQLRQEIFFCRTQDLILLGCYKPQCRSIFLDDNNVLKHQVPNRVWFGVNLVQLRSPNHPYK
mmetsp:Transcript_43324/g.131820  ORF Transcript_43324/g.131820 Transcript_43324/m.131820 type:complete len:147 (+) Transcript_43324:495-935(+)